MAKKLSIYQIKAKYEAGKGPRYFFAPDTLKFYHQRVSSFKVAILDGKTFIHAPSSHGVTLCEVIEENEGKTLDLRIVPSSEDIPILQRLGAI